MSGLILCIIAALGTATEAEPVNPLDTFFEEFAAKRAPIHHVSATYKETAFVGDDFFETEGKVLFVRPRRLLRQTVKPEPSSILIDDRTLYQYEPEVLQLVVEELEDLPEADLLFFGFDGNLATLKDSYDISLFLVKDDPEAGQGVLIKPFTEDVVDAPFIEVNLYLRTKDYLPYRIDIITDEDAHTKYVMDHYEVNGDLDPSETQLFIPEGTDIINGDEFIESVGPEGKRMPAAAMITDLPGTKPEEDVEVDSEADTTDEDGDA